VVVHIIRIMITLLSRSTILDYTMNCKRKFYRLVLLILITACTYSHALASDILTNPRYTDLQNEFLNINPDLFFEIDIPDMTSQERDNLIQGASAGSALKFEEVFSTDNLSVSQFGSAYSCVNDFEDNAVCWYATGGSRGEFTGGNRYQEVLLRLRLL
jgi:hypothetical protein